jgi:hypothetical protein
MTEGEGRGGIKFGLNIHLYALSKQHTRFYSPKAKMKMFVIFLVSIVG